MTDDDIITRPRPAPAAAEDLSEEICRSVEKRPGDQVKCTRVSVDGYRCNWWSKHSTSGYDNPAMTGLLVTTHRVRKSRFLRVTRDAGRLLIAELPTG